MRMTRRSKMNDTMLATGMVSAMLLVGALGTTGCDGFCNTDADCDDGATCVNHLCVTIPVQDGCWVDGVYYEIGDSFPSSDGCNTCYCDGDDRVMCTEMACLYECDPSKVFCDSLPPSCPDGMVVSVEGGCWGPCVNAYQCLPMECSFEADCPEGFHCEGSSVCPPDLECFWEGEPGTCAVNGPDYGAPGDACNVPSDCQDGLACCYPCGVAGCQNQCTVPCTDEPWCAGGCPMYP